MDQEKRRRIATASGSAVVVVGMLVFFFASESVAQAPIEARVVAALLAIAVMLVGLRRYFARRKF